MTTDVNLQPRLREEASEMLRQLWGSEREQLLTKCWTSHDAHWFNAVAREYGVEAANRLNQVAVRAIGMAEAQRIARALGLLAVTSLDDYLRVQEALIALLEPESLGYRVIKRSDREFEVLVQRCVASDSAAQTGAASEYQCPIYARLAGWLDAFGLAHTTVPTPGTCPRLHGHECLHTITVEREPVRSASQAA